MTRTRSRMPSKQVLYPRDTQGDRKPGYLSFAAAYPTALLPYDAIRAASDKVLRDDGKSALQIHQPPRYARCANGFVRARKKGVRVAQKTYSLPRVPAGAGLIGKVFLEKGDGAVREAPATLARYRRFPCSSQNSFPVTLDDAGVNIQELQRAQQNPRYLLVPNSRNRPAIPIPKKSAGKRRRLCGKQIRFS
jgi:2-aminoadipate transaminase